MCVVPHLSDQFMPPQKVLEELLILRAFRYQPVGPWVADPVAEHGIQSKAGFVDEIVHVAFEAAIVVTCEQKPGTAVKVDPAGKMDRVYARETPLGVDHAGC